MQLQGNRAHDELGQDACLRDSTPLRYCGHRPSNIINVARVDHCRLRAPLRSSHGRPPPPLLSIVVKTRTRYSMSMPGCGSRRMVICPRTPFPRTLSQRYHTPPLLPHRRLSCPLHYEGRLPSRFTPALLGQDFRRTREGGHTRHIVHFAGMHGSVRAGRLRGTIPISSLRHSFQPLHQLPRIPQPHHSGLFLLSIPTLKVTSIPRLAKSRAIAMLDMCPIPSPMYLSVIQSVALGCSSMPAM